MTTVFGKGLRGRRKAAEDDGEVAQIADAANLWWTRRDFVQHPAVRGGLPREHAEANGAGAPAAPRARTAPTHDLPGAAFPPAAPTEPAPAERSFSELFTTESLFARPGDAAGVTATGPSMPGGTRGGPSSATGPAPRPATGPRAATARPGRPAGSATPGPAPQNERAVGAEQATRPEPPRAARKQLPANHPLAPALEHLGLGRDATWTQIQHTYRALAKVAHPDHTGDNGETMSLLNAAYSSLRQARAYGLFDDDGD